LLNLVYAIIIFSCANPVSPTGGPKDEDPPEVLNSEPDNYSLNFSDDNIQIFFDEYVQLNNPGEQVVISPPLEQKPEYKLKGKSVLINLNDTLKDNTTYTFFFGDAIADLNEKNPLVNFQYVFATGDHLDSLFLEGYVLNALNLEPQENIWVMLYADTRDSVPYLRRPFYIARTAKDGFFRFYNLGDRSYKLFALMDANSNYLYDLPNEAIAFSDSLVRPYYFPPSINMVSDSAVDTTAFDNIVDTAAFDNVVDTAAFDSVVDTAAFEVVVDSALYDIIPVVMYLFEEVDSTQAIIDSKIIIDGCIRIIFRFPTIVPEIAIINHTIDEEWYIEDFNKTKDTLNFWIIQKTPDTIELEVKENNIVLDTLKFIREEEGPKSLIKVKDKEIPRIKIGTSANRSRPLEINTPLIFTSEYPVDRFDFSEIIFVENEDTLVPSFQYYDTVHRKIMIDHQWKHTTKYSLMIPDSTIFDIKGLTNDTIKLNFLTKSPEDYGSLKLNITVKDVESQYILQLMNEKEAIIAQMIMSNNDLIEFPLLKPGNYKVKVIFDQNRNGRWDTGNYLQKLQPEKVTYFPTIINIRANWISEELWEI